jgi:hypothetical protein
MRSDEGSQLLPIFFTGQVSSQTQSEAAACHRWAQKHTAEVSL